MDWKDLCAIMTVLRVLVDREDVSWPTSYKEPRSTFKWACNIYQSSACAYLKASPLDVCDLALGVACGRIQGPYN